MAQLNQSDLLGTGVDDVSREEARVRDKIREVLNLLALRGGKYKY